MGILSGVLTGRKGIDQVAMASPYGPSSYVAIEDLRTWTGRGISPELAYNLITIYQCVRVLSETFAAMPLMLYRRLPGGGKDRATDHHLYDTLHRRPNSQMTSFIWRELLMSHVATWGNSYNEKRYDTAGRLSLWPIRPDRIEPFYYSAQQATESPFLVSPGDKGYWYIAPGRGRVEFNPALMFHVQGLSSNGLVGLSPISVMRTTLDLYSTAERFGTKFFDNDARPGVILSHPQNLSTEAINRLRAQTESMKGPDNAGRTLVVEEGLTVSEVGIHPEDAQFMETRLFQKREIAAAYRIQPHKIGDLERATFSNIEHLSIEFIQDTMLPWFVRVEMQINTQLLTELEQADDELFAAFNVDGYLRGDAASRAEALATRWQHGTINADEWRALENENPLPDGLGRQYYVPVNYQTVENASKPPAPALADPQQPPELRVVASNGATRSLAQFDCGECGKMINRLASPGSVGWCKSCKVERTMAEIEPAPAPAPVVARRREIERDEEGRLVAVVDYA